MDFDAVTRLTDTLGLGWVKVQIDWDLLQAERTRRHRSGFQAAGIVSGRPQASGKDDIGQRRPRAGLGQDEP